VNLEDSFGPMHGEVGKFAKQLFPNDKEIQEIRGWPTQEEIRAHSARTVD
jgi:hypothetical protein